MDWNGWNGTGTTMIQTSKMISNNKKEVLTISRFGCLILADKEEH